MKYKLFKEYGGFISLEDDSRVQMLEAEEVYTSGGWQADGWVELPDRESALAYFLIREISEEEKQLYELYAKVYNKTLEENTRILDLRLSH